MVKFMFAVQGADRAVFAATDGLTGVELWRTDGTAAGTVLHQDILPGSDSSNPGVPTPVGCVLMFSARNATQGRELWRMDMTASSSVYGIGCAGSGGRHPRIAGAGGAPTLGNAGYGVQVSNALPSSASFALLHLGRGELPMGNGCTYYGNPLLYLTTIGVPTDATGIGLVPLPVPNDSSLACLQVFAQHAVLDPSGSLANSLALSEGLKIVFNPN